jgi:DNA adenine methylase
MNTTIKRASALNYFGGKSRQLDWMLPLLPDKTSYRHYVEAFCGSAAVFLNKEPSPIETINDLNGSLINFFRTLRERPAELIQRLELTPYSRAEFIFSADPTADPVESAARFFTRCIQSFGGSPDGSARFTSWRTQVSQSRGGAQYGS